MPQREVSTFSPEFIQNSEKPDSPDQVPYNFPSPGSSIPQFAIGMAKSIPQSFEGWRQMTKKIADVIPHSPFPQGDIPPVPEWMREPKNLPQQWEKNIGMAGQYAAGAAAVPFSAIPQGLMAAGIAGAQSGGDPESMLGMGILGVWPQESLVH